MLQPGHTGGHAGRPRLLTEHCLEGPDPSLPAEHVTHVISTHLTTSGAILYTPSGTFVPVMGWEHPRLPVQCQGLDADPRPGKLLMPCDNSPVPIRELPCDNFLYTPISTISK